MGPVTASTARRCIGRATQPIAVAVTGVRAPLPSRVVEHPRADPPALSLSLSLSLCPSLALRSSASSSFLIHDTSL